MEVVQSGKMERRNCRFRLMIVMPLESSKLTIVALLPNSWLENARLCGP
jgi:hypothetical protein